MVAMEELKKDQFMQGLRKDLEKGLKMARVLDSFFNELINQAFAI